jgi:MFS family permease
MPNRHAPALLAFALCIITLAVNLQAPLYITYADLSGRGAAATAVAFSGYVLGVLPVLLALGGLADRVGRRPLILAALGLSMLATLLMLLAPSLETLGVARLFLGLGTGLASATATAYMGELMAGSDSSRAANWVTASTSLGFGLGAALTSLFLLAGPSLTPGSFHLQLLLAFIAIVLVWRLPDPRPAQRTAMLRLPCYPAGPRLWLRHPPGLGLRGPGDRVAARDLASARLERLVGLFHLLRDQLRPVVPAHGPALAECPSDPTGAGHLALQLRPVGLGRGQRRTARCAVRRGGREQRLLWLHLPRRVGRGEPIGRQRKDPGQCRVLPACVHGVQPASDFYRVAQ